MEQALGDLDLASEMGRLNDNLRSMRPDLPWTGRQRLRGDEPLGLGDATEALADLADLDSLAEALEQDYAGASLEDVDEEAVRTGARPTGRRRPARTSAGRARARAAGLPHAQGR